MAETLSSNQTLIFTYGTLKRGFHNHTLMRDLISRNDAAFLGSYSTLLPHPLVCGPHGIPYLIPLPGSGRRVHGELYSVSPPALARLDLLEGLAVSHYQRLPIRLVPRAAVSDAQNAAVSAEAYFAHQSFAEALWERNRREGLEEYSEREGIRYIKREDRPNQGRAIVDDVWAFLASSDGDSQSQG